MITLSKKRNTSSMHTELKPQLTSLVDAMTLIVIFLVQSFSMEGNLVTPSDDLKLPVSQSQTAAKPLFSIKISKEYLLADDIVIAKTAALQGGDSLMIPALDTWLKQNVSQSGQNTSELMIQSDKDISFDIIKKVMFTCSQAGKTDFTILVVNEG